MHFVRNSLSESSEIVWYRFDVYNTEILHYQARMEGGGRGKQRWQSVTLYAFKLSNLIQLVVAVLTTRFLYVFLSYLRVGSRYRQIIILLCRVACILQF
jgi:hypothetical protein